MQDEFLKLIEEERKESQTQTQSLLEEQKIQFQVPVFVDLKYSHITLQMLFFFFLISQYYVQKLFSKNNQFILHLQETLKAHLEGERKTHREAMDRVIELANQEMRAYLQQQREVSPRQHYHDSLNRCSVENSARDLYLC